MDDREGIEMWLQVAMVANVLTAEREARIGQVERIRWADGEDESGFADGPLRPIVALIAMVILATVCRIVLV